MTLSLRSLISAGSMLLALAFLASPTLAQDKKPDATIDVIYAQVALGAAVTTARGKLHFNGETHEFEVGGLGIGGVGINEVKASGSVYGLTKVEDFYGFYGKMSAAAAVGEGASTITMENNNGVMVEIDSDNQGLVLSISANGATVKELKK